jgi:hypothetical protein
VVSENFVTKNFIICESSPNKTTMIKSIFAQAGHVAYMEEKRNAYKVLVGKPEGNRPLGICRCRWEKQY